jgi:hypothetical protein
MPLNSNECLSDRRDVAKTTLCVVSPAIAAVDRNRLITDPYSDDFLPEHSCLYGRCGRLEKGKFSRWGILRIAVLQSTMSNEF